MRPFCDYGVYIFDCDGVILDSNSSKINAMRLALESFANITDGVEDSIKYFSENFGRSRYHHVKEFLKVYLVFQGGAPEQIEGEILNRYAAHVDELYAHSMVVPSIESVLSKLLGLKYVASGSEQSQLRKVLTDKGLSNYFEGVFGSPKGKNEIVCDILEANESEKNVVMIGDALADLEVASNNGIDFVGILKYSNTPNLLRERCAAFGYPVISDWSDMESAINGV